MFNSPPVGKERRLRPVLLMELSTETVDQAILTVASQARSSAEFYFLSNMLGFTEEDMVRCNTVLKSSQKSTGTKLENNG